jgi:hypothetical protein
MKKLSNKRIRMGLLTAALAGGTILGATQVGGIVNAQVDDVPTEEQTDTTTPADVDDLTTEQREQRREEHQEHREARREARMANAEEVAGLIGVEVEDIHEWVRGGGTLAEIAEQNGVAVDDVVKLIVDQKNERIDEAVENGRIEADEADEKRAEVEERVTTRVTEGRPERGEGEGHGHRGERGPRGGGGGAPADAEG